MDHPYFAPTDPSRLRAHLEDEHDVVSFLRPRRSERYWHNWHAAAHDQLLPVEPPVEEGGVLEIPGEPPRILVALTWQDIADLRSGLECLDENAGSEAAHTRLTGLERRLGEVHQQLPNPLDIHAT
jgi:hypothetical protein